MDEIKIIMDMQCDCKKKNMYKTLASRLEGRDADQVGGWIRVHKKNVLRGLRLA